jgi:hypothetical protein
MNRRRCLFLCLPAMAGLPGCGVGGDEPTPLDLMHVPSDSLGPVAAGTRVFRNIADWTAFWNAHPYPNPLGVVTAPAVDFGRHAVAGVFAGAKPRCQSLQIHAGERQGSVVTLRWRIVTFGQATPSSCIGSDMFTFNLADLVLVPADAAELRFIQETA